MPSTRAQLSGIRSDPNHPNRSIAAPIASCPAIRIPMVAAVPMREPAKVTVRTMKSPIAPPTHSHAGCRRIAPYEPRLWRATSSSAAARIACRRIANASAPKIPARSPSRAITATCTDPASPASIAIAIASPLMRANLPSRRGLVALEEPEHVPLGVLAVREPAGLRDRHLVACLAAELPHLPHRRVDVVGVHVDDVAASRLV